MESMTILIAILLAGLGAVFGSFAGAAVWRIYTKKDFVSDRSECEHCHHKLGAHDLIPVFSWLALRGKCRYCGAPIGREALLAELGLATYFAVSFLVWPHELISLLSWLDFGLWLALGVGLTILFIYDLKWYLLPDRVIYPLIALAGVDFGLHAVTLHWSLATIGIEVVLALAAVSGFYGLLYIASKGEWVGFGDVKLGIVMGLFLGWQVALLAVFMANLIGTLVLLPKLLRGRLDRRDRIPFGPFLILGLVISGLWGRLIIDWYFALLDGNIR